MFEAIDDYTEVYRHSIQTWHDRVIRHYFNGSRFREELFGSIFVTIILYWAVGFLFSAYDLTGRPKFFLRYKVQPLANVQSDKDNLRSLVKQVLLNQLLALVFGLGLMVVRHGHMHVQTRLPTLSHFVGQWTAFILVREVLFYYSHRMLHHPSLYRHIHKRHHEWQTPIALTAIYCHPFEHIVGNLLPVLAGPALLNSHILVNHVWMLWVIMLTLNDHSGYHFPFCFPPTFHDFHHLK